MSDDKVSDDKNAGTSAVKESTSAGGSAYGCAASRGSPEPQTPQQPAHHRNRRRPRPQAIRTVRAAQGPRRTRPCRKTPAEQGCAPTNPVPPAGSANTPPDAPTLYYPAAPSPRGPKLIPGASVAGGRYRLLAPHGGTRGLQFWQALDVKLDREVALTFVDAEQRGDDNAQSGSAGRALPHPAPGPDQLAGPGPGPRRRPRQLGRHRRRRVDAWPIAAGDGRDDAVADRRRHARSAPRGRCRGRSPRRVARCPSITRTGCASASTATPYSRSRPRLPTPIPPATCAVSAPCSTPSSPLGGRWQTRRQPDPSARCPPPARPTATRPGIPSSRGYPSGGAVRHLGRGHARHCKPRAESALPPPCSTFSIRHPSSTTRRN